jgi:reverse gyrase
LREEFRTRFGEGEERCFNCGGPYHDERGDTHGCEWCPALPPEREKALLPWLPELDAVELREQLLRPVELRRAGRLSRLRRALRVS